MKPKQNELWRWGAPLLLGLLIWFSPCPNGLKPQAWHMFAIFAGTICGILTAPLASGSLMIIALALSYFTGTLSFGQTLAGFSSGAVWMIWSACILSIGFVKSGLGRRIAYSMLSKFGGSSLGVAYALGTADLIMAPAMPSVTARSGGIILPVVKAINGVLGSGPGKTGKKIGDFLVMTCFHFTPITGALFMTGMAANPLCVTLAKDGFNVDITWGGWLWAALVPALICFFLLPLVTFKFMNPDMKKTPEAKEIDRKSVV